MPASPWSQANVVVTGAASGIGLALSRALVARGANVWMADCNAGKLEQEAIALGPGARPCTLDVRDAAAVRALIESVVRDTGRIDYLFNNAGIAIAGEAHDMKVEHFDRLIDVNIRGIVNGVAAAYPLMVEQRSGHIVNTASLAGLTPAPLLAAYAMTKHAVIGLSASLRVEARQHGVRVSALCPGVIETPLLDAANPPDLPAVDSVPDMRRYLTRLAGAPHPADKLARAALRGVERNRGLIVVPLQAWFIALAYRLFPALVRFVVEDELRETLGAAAPDTPAIPQPVPRGAVALSAPALGIPLPMPRAAVPSATRLERPSPAAHAGAAPHRPLLERQSPPARAVAAPRPQQPPVVIGQDPEPPPVASARTAGRPSAGFAKRPRRPPTASSSGRGS